jgi:hypothetical protein
LATIFLFTQLGCGDDGGTSPKTHSGSDVDDSVSPASDGIETVVIDSRPISTGIITLQEPFPVLLFEDGSACNDMNFVVQDLDAASHREDNPAKWTEWKRINGKVALLKSGAWSKLADDGEYAPQARGFALDGSFRHVSSYSVGTFVNVNETTYRFLPGHRFAVSGAAVFTTGNANGGSTQADQQGTYEVDGYVLRLHYESGREALSSLVSGEADPRTIYVGGTWFSLETAR